MSNEVLEFCRIHNIEIQEEEVKRYRTVYGYVKLNIDGNTIIAEINKDYFNDITLFIKELFSEIYYAYDPGS